MKTIDRRLRRLQGRLCPDNGQPQRLWVLTQPGCQLALDLDRCTQILDECSFLPTGRFGVVDLLGIPEHLTARELEQFLRRNHTENAGRPTESSWRNGAQMASGGI
jgi:hypothetical protein